MAGYDITEAQAQQLLNFDVELDINVLDTVVAYMFSGTPAQV